MARPTTLTPEITKAICAHLEIGLPLHLAAEAEYVPRATAYQWEKNNAEFAEEVAHARAQGAIRITNIVLEGGKGSSMAGWLLERRWRDDYAPPKKEEVQPSEVRITIEGGLPREVSQAMAPEVTKTPSSDIGKPSA